MEKKSQEPPAPPPARPDPAQSGGPSPGLRKVLLKYTREIPEFLFLGGVLCLIAIASYAAYVNVVAKGWNGDAAGWAQAAGSITAIAGAVWLARAESRQARRWRRAQGEEAAWAVRFVIAQAQFDAQIVAAELAKLGTPYRATLLEIQSWSQRSANVSLALQTMLTRADYIHPAVIITICNAKILIDQLSVDLATLQQAVRKRGLPNGQLVGDIVSAHINLNTLLSQYDGRMRGVREALDQGRDMLPIGNY